MTNSQSKNTQQAGSDVVAALSTLLAAYERMKNGERPSDGAERQARATLAAGQPQAEPVGVLIDVLVKFVDIMDGCGNWPDTSTSQVKLGDLAKEAVAAIGQCRAVQSKPAQPPAVAVPDVVEQIAQQWDGCMYDSADGCHIDIGQGIRQAGQHLAAAQKGGE